MNNIKINTKTIYGDSILGDQNLLLMKYDNSNNIDQISYV